MLGVMGLTGIAIDLGTSLTAGIALGAGSALATHDLWYRRSYPPDEVARHVGPVLWLSIVLISVGFGVLALGRSPVLHRLGLLAGASLLLSALVTSLLVPAVSNKVRT
jgi:predicted RND superfamily exporter protein